MVLQAVERLSLTPKVYVGIPRRNGVLKRRRGPILKLFRMLGLGLVVIDPDLETGSVDVLLDPGEYKPRKSKHRRERLLGEFVRRVGDPNLGGAEKRKGIMTAYRQRALAIGGFLQEKRTDQSFACSPNSPRAESPGYFVPGRIRLVREGVAWCVQAFPSRRAGDSSVGKECLCLSRGRAPRLTAEARADHGAVYSAESPGSRGREPGSGLRIGARGA